jgi:integrase
MAMITKRSGKKGVSYLIRTFSGYDINGKQIEKTMTWKPDENMTPKQIEKAVNEAAILFEKKVKEGVMLDGNIRFADFAEKWINEYGLKQLAPKTVERYKSLLARVNQGIGNIRLDKLQPHHLQELYNNLGEEGINKRNSYAICITDLVDVIKKNNMTRAAIAQKAGLAPVTVSSACKGKHIRIENAKEICKVLKTEFPQVFKVEKDKSILSDNTLLHHHRVISSVLQTAVQWQIIFDNPARRVRPPKVSRKEAIYLEDTDLPNILEALSNAPIKWRTAVMLLLYSGIRRGEFCGLEWKDVDFKNCLIHIRRTSQYISGIGVIEKDTKNISSERVMKLPQDMFILFNQYRKWQVQERLSMGDKWNAIIPIKDAEGKIKHRENDRVFTQENGLPIFPDSITTWINRFQKKYNLPKFTPHTLRHTNISLLIAAGVPIRNVSQRAGHAQLSTTSNIYAHAIKTVDEMAAAAIGDILKPKNIKQG